MEEYRKKHKDFSKVVRNCYCPQCEKLRNGWI